MLAPPRVGRSQAGGGSDLSVGELPEELITTSPLMLNVMLSSYYQRTLRQEPKLHFLSDCVVRNAGEGL